MDYDCNKSLTAGVTCPLKLSMITTAAESQLNLEQTPSTYGRIIFSI